MTPPELLLQVMAYIVQKTVNEGPAVKDAPFLIILNNEAEAMDAAALYPVIGHQLKSRLVQKTGLVLHIEIGISHRKINDENSQRIEIAAEQDLGIEEPHIGSCQNDEKAGHEADISAKTVLLSPKPHEKQRKAGVENQITPRQHAVNGIHVAGRKSLPAFGQEIENPRRHRQKSNPLHPFPAIFIAFEGIAEIAEKEVIIQEHCAEEDTHQPRRKRRPLTGIYTHKQQIQKKHRRIHSHEVQERPGLPKRQLAVIHVEEKDNQLHRQGGQKEINIRYSRCCKHDSSSFRQSCDRPDFNRPVIKQYSCISL